MRPIDAEPIEKFIENGLNCKDPKKRFGHDAIEILTEIHYAPTISPSLPPNPPLTLEELREMDGEPVWVIHPQNKFEPCWMLVMVRCNFVLANWQVCNFSDYGHTWLAYRRKPEEAEKNV